MLHTNSSIYHRRYMTLRIDIFVKLNASLSLSLCLVSHKVLLRFGNTLIKCLFREMQMKPRSLRRRSTAARLLGLRARIPSVTWVSSSCECRVLSGRGLCDELITRPEGSYRVCVSLSVIGCNNNALHLQLGRLRG